ncbi:hypothetical protein AN7586.2 [Aspergillus nidulans FGSC A4]|uniref:Uncharacterized protein n=1 Tax=Emericella nidulans (strain FGSC A4 / ATCC 38163 / CBS 112.46 / NRRL 194 / M139) TaxID=227321 RepID=Q5AVU4_EMENI|nr:hypothetical protein [Aspergillus nidulans FGSC A4]EAA62166.1 hypothetical protein AN7586.2 [Aspergillus nidulans FGSC A4]CBF79681.1 TPA: hypothetical protein ANIA_07586 [Aspergillus nidulans FGSC A4]|eukprot:XP_680855.1 hypothetical protein AN7586.2 [Aspergillus nidulans FGSC A4]
METAGCQRLAHPCHVIAGPLSNPMLSDHRQEIRGLLTGHQQTDDG